MAQAKKESRPESRDRRLPAFELVQRMDDMRQRPVSIARPVAQSTHGSGRWADRALNRMGLVAFIAILSLQTYLALTGDVTTQVIALAILVILVSAMAGTAVYAVNQAQF